MTSTPTSSERRAVRRTQTTFGRFVTPSIAGFH